MHIMLGGDYMNKRIALLYGGEGHEHEVSVMGYRYVLKLLKGANYDVKAVYIDKNGRWFIGEEQVFPHRCGDKGFLQTESGDKITVDAAIPLLHGDGGESGEVQGALKIAGIPFIGADTLTGAICLDKHYTKCIAKELGIPVADWVCFPKGTDVDTALAMCEAKLHFPVFIKPRRLGSSFGAHAAHTQEEFREAFTQSSSISEGLTIAEELIENKRELECAFYSANGQTVISNPGEILNMGLYGFEEKYVNSAKTSIQANVDEGVKELIKNYSMLLGERCCLRHLARIDYFLSDNKLIFNEINTFPGFTEQSLYPKMIEAAGISPQKALQAFIEDACKC